MGGGITTQKYSQETFETKLRDYFAANANDEDWGEMPEVDRSTISYDQEKAFGQHAAGFRTIPHWYTLIGDRNGAVTMFYGTF